MIPSYLLLMESSSSLSEERENPKMCAHTQYQKCLLNNALRHLFLMQSTQTEIILSFRLNYIPYISGPSWGFFPPSSFNS